MKYSISEIVSIIGAERYGREEGSVQFLLTDSRSLFVPESTLFFAIRTAKGNGHRYIEELYRRGVRHFVVSELPHLADFPDANFLLVSSALDALQRLAAYHRQQFQIPVIGITGSNGKTMVKEWLSQVLQPQYHITRSPRSYNSQVGVPLSLWLIDQDTEVAVIEAGISKPNEMERLAQTIQPTMTVLTNVGEAHQENFPSKEAKYREKLRLALEAQTVVFSADDATILPLLRAQGFSGEQLTWSLTGKDATLSVKKIEKDTHSTTIHYLYKGTTSAFSIPFIDDASIENAIIVALVALQYNLPLETLNAQLSKLEPVAMRLEVKEGANLCTLINDSYNSDIHSLAIALDFMQRRPDHEGRRRTLILSDMLESGEQPEVLYGRVADLIERRGIEKFIAVGPMLTSQQSLFHVKEQYFFQSAEDLLNSPLMQQFHAEVILLKGARRFGMERISEALVKRVHETVLEVNLKAVVENLDWYRSFLRPDTRLTCMIKADGYGTGAVEIAKTLQDHRVDYLAVAVADEGASLRRNGITANIMVMNPEMSAFKTLFDYHLEPEIYSFRLLEAMIEAAEREGLTNYPVHLKLDTGMHRLGFDPDHDVPALIQRLKQQTALMPRSVFSHFVGSDSDSFDDFSQLQYDRFERGSQLIVNAFDHKILRHIDNSAGIEHFPERQLDMCRLGLGLYGINPRTNKPLACVATLKTTILQLRHVPAGDSVGYSRRTILERDSVIAAIPIGYADGLRRALGNRCGYCIVNGQQADYVGNICMDVAMIDVTGIPCKEGDSVEIFGRQLSVSTLADAIGTIPYELLTAVSPRVKRVYFQE